MNKYITALLVVLAATGVEAQSYQSALKVALGDFTFEEICHQPEFTGLETELRSIIEAYKSIRKEKETEPAKVHATVYTELHPALLPYPLSTDPNYSDHTILPNASVCSSITIRAPSSFHQE
ncbi:hypothetical protein [Prevotella dentasini]|uniref:hypothetical protein n=1 Tax=Prevotella dentasini TaxID=589537 RepID=UPI00046A5702|nr:hypothetical protein [Prevotella dentasini]